MSTSTLHHYPGRRRSRNRGGRIRRLALPVLLCAGLQASLALGAPAADISGQILAITERLYLEGEDRHAVGDSTILEPDLVSAFYHARAHEAAWTDPDYAREMLDLLSSSAAEGLNPADYHYDLLVAVVEAGFDNAAARARADVMLTDGLLHYARHLIQGKVDPRTLDSTWNYSRRDFDPGDVAVQLATAIEERTLAERFEALKLDTPFYRTARQELARYRVLAADESFAPLAEDVVLRPGDDHPAVTPLRRRLVDLGYLANTAPASTLFDSGLEAAVRDLQRDHGLDVDGVVGAQSYAALNLSYADKVDMLRVNLDRMRWISDDLSDEFIVVNIAGFELYYLRNRDLVWETPVMVGNINTRTPIFQAPLRYLEFNPTWNAPRSLVRRSVFPKISANPQYAVEKGYRLYDAAGRSVDPLTLDYSQYTAGNFPFRVVQMPGPANAMGQVKFMFPNRHAVYLHDTPSRSLFARSQRAFSAGCIRVKEPLELARLLLDDPQNWSAERIDTLLESGAPQQVARITRPIDVMLMYWTISPTPAGRLQFHHDIYGLDPAALAALDTPSSPRAL